MMNPLCLFHMLVVEYRWIPIVFYTLNQVLAVTLVSIFSEVTAKDGAMIDAIACIGQGAYNKKVQAEMADVLWGDYEVVIADGTETCVVSGGTLDGNTAVTYPQQTAVSFTINDADKGGVSITYFAYMNYMALFAFIPYYFGITLYNFVMKSGNWWGTGMDEAYLTALTEVKLGVYYRRYLMLASTTTSVIFLWTLYEGAVTHGMSNFIFGLIAGIITVLMALPPAKGKVVVTGDIADGVGLLKQFNTGIVTKLKQIFMVNSDVFSTQMAFFNFPENFATAPAPSALPKPMQVLSFIDACFGEGDLEALIPNKNTYGGTHTKKKTALGKAKGALGTADEVAGGFGF